MFEPCVMKSRICDDDNPGGGIDAAIPLPERAAGRA